MLQNIKLVEVVQLTDRHIQKAVILLQSVKTSYLSSSVKVIRKWKYTDKASAHLIFTNF